MSLFQTALATDKGINYTNMVLMLLSAALAFIIPFQLFLFVYAVLGPLHYVTEMSWLEKRNFFIEKKTDVWLYLLMSVLLTIPAFDPDVKIARFGVTFMMTAFFFTLIIFFVKQPILKYILTFVVFFVLIGFNANTNERAIFWFGIMLPTIIHVFGFTGLFILYGALKNKSTTGIISFAVFIACAVSFFFLLPPSTAAPASQYIQNTLSNFDIINRALLLLFGLDGSVTNLNEALSIPNLQLFTSPAAIIVARFIAFAYTYHYLNWFSKTTVIKWHEVSKKRMTLILFLWLGSIAAYMFDYNFGFKVLFLFSIMHVLLEFPLNLVSIRGIGFEIISRLQKKS